MKKNIFYFIFLICIFLLSGPYVRAQTVNYNIYGLATPRIYHMSTYGNWSTTASYYASLPTLSANDTFCCIAASQTLTNKTLTSPTMTSPTMTSPVITGTVDASDGITVGPGAGIDVESALISIKAASPTV